jgi:hypothetical protein
VQFTIPASAQPGQSYRVQFRNVDGARDFEQQYEFESLAARVWVNAPASEPQDTISDEWKIQFFGAVENPLADAQADPDADGIVNWREYLAGTDPTDADSRLRLRAPEHRLNNGHREVHLRWLSAPGKKYVLETTTDLVGSEWSLLGSGIVGDGRIKEFLDSNTAGGAQYYRVRLQE